MIKSDNFVDKHRGRCQSSPGVQQLNPRSFKILRIPGDYGHAMHQGIRHHVGIQQKHQDRSADSNSFLFLFGGSKSISAASGMASSSTISAWGWVTFS